MRLPLDLISPCLDNARFILKGAAGEWLAALGNRFQGATLPPVLTAPFMLTRTQMMQYLRERSPVIAPSMLKCDFGNLQEEAARIDAADLPLYHLDIMDGHFVPNLSYGAMVIAGLREKTEVPFDAHLMISNPAAFLEDYIKAGCEAITIHLEAVPDPVELLKEIRSRNIVSGLAINPETSFEQAAPFLKYTDLLLVMSVRPGFGGQKFIPDVLPKITAAREAAGPELLISVDGGVAESTIGACAAAGADIFVAGSSIFDHADYGAAGVCLAEAISRFTEVA